MKRYLFVSLAVCVCVALIASVGFAKNVEKEREHFEKQAVKESLPYLVDQPLNATAQAGTTTLGSWNFDSGGTCIDQGWTTIDGTEQLGEYWHVDDFAGLGGGDFNGLYPLDQTKSMWCGARPDGGSLILCGYQSLPGYGNNWAQMLCTPCLTVTGDVDLTYLIAWDSEPGYDATSVQYDLCDENWIDLYGGVGVYDGYGSATEAITIADSLHGGSVRIRFNFASDGAWSDEDGSWNTDGAVIVDSLTVADAGGVISFEDFEGATVGDNSTSEWASCNQPGYGIYADLYPGIQQLQLDPCESHLTCLWGFLTGSSDTYACGGYPGQDVIPYMNSRDQYFHNEIRSPIVPFVGSGTKVEVDLQMYRDLPLDNLIFGRIAVRSFVGGCPDNWHNTLYQFGGPTPNWFRWIEDVGDEILPGATDVQISIWAVDQCDVWCGIYGTGACHSNAPLYDDIIIRRIDIAGPQWELEPFQLFQDNFATDGSTTGTVRVDMALDLLPGNNLNIHPGDSLSCTVIDPQWGVGPDAYTGSGAAVYAYVSPRPNNIPGRMGGDIVDDPVRWPVVDSTLGPNGNKWYVIHMDSCYSNQGGAIVDDYCFDLNDNLFVPGDTIWYFLAAQSNDGPGSWSYYWNSYNYLDNADQSGSTKSGIDLAEAYANAMEMTCLPAAQIHGGDILYVDGADGRQSQPLYDTAFQMLALEGKVDRFDILGPSSNIANRLGSRVQNVYQQVIDVYRKIIWETRDLQGGAIGDGLGNPEKSNDAYVLWTFADQHPNNPGMYLSGWKLATEWNSLLGSDAISLRGTYMNFNIVTTDHKLLGMPTFPLVIGETGGPFYHATGPDTVLAAGGCPVIRQFDVLSATGLSANAMTYEGNTSWAAVLQQVTPNSANSTTRVLLNAFSYDRIRDVRPTGLPARVEHLYDVITWLQNPVQVPIPVPQDRFSYALNQNYPNPFNPTTTIEFTVKEQSHVTLRIYNVAGQLVKTLVNEAVQPGMVHQLTWDGRNDAGSNVASGVYFYRLVANDFVQTKKMVLLK